MENQRELRSSILALLLWGGGMGMAVEAHASKGAEVEIGDPNLGLVAAILVLGTDQPNVAPQGVFAIFPETKNPSRRRDVYLDQLAKSNTEPPRRHFQRYAIEVDGRAYQTTQVHPWGRPRYSAALPYTPKSIAVTAHLSTGEEFVATVAVPAGLRADRGIDTRQDEIGKVSDGYATADPDADARGEIVPPYRDQTGYRIYDYAGGGRGLNIATTCLGSKASGRIVHSRLVIKQHYFYAPTGDLTLSETTYHQPVYGTDESVTFNSPLHAVFKPDGSFELKPLRIRRTDDLAVDDLAFDPQNEYAARFVFECRTEKGKMLRREFEYRWKHLDPHRPVKDSTYPNG